MSTKITVESPNTTIAIGPCWPDGPGGPGGPTTGGLPPGGETGDVPVKASNADYDVEWKSPEEIAAEASAINWNSTNW